MSKRRELISQLLEVSTDAKSISQIHSHLLRCGLLAASECLFASRLVSKYAKHCSSPAARRLFDDMPHPNTKLWNAVLRSHFRAQQWMETLRLFRRMANNPSDLDAFTLPIALRSCAALAELLHGRAIHAASVKKDLHGSDVFVAAALVEMYAKCCKMDSACSVFEGFMRPDVVLWTSMVSGYQQNGNARHAVVFFSRMVVERHVVPDSVTLVSIVSALGQLGDFRGGRCCHGFVLRMGYFHDISLMNSILNLYSKLERVGTARKLFERMPEKDVISWSCMISCYARNGDPKAALEVYNMMVEKGLQPSYVTVVSVLQACSLSCDLSKGKELHEVAIQLGFELELSLATSLIDMYMNCSCYKEAIRLFYRMPKRDAVTWAAAIDGCSKNGFDDESFKLFKAMLLSTEVYPDAVLMVKVLVACSRMGVLSQASCLHGYLIRCGFSDNVYVASALVDLYSKCGRLDDAVRVFESRFEKDVVLWSSMIAGYGINGCGSKAIEAFEHMVELSIKPNNVTFVSVLSACSHNGMVQQGRRIFDNMVHAFGVAPNSLHYCIMVDLLARNGELREALSLVEKMPKPKEPHIWCALLSGCRLYQDIEMGQLVAQRLLETDPSYAGYYSLLANVYAVGGKWSDAEVVKRLMKERGMKKMPGCSAVEICNEVQMYLAGQEMCQVTENAFDSLRAIKVKEREEGYASTNNLFSPIEVEMPPFKTNITFFVTSPKAKEMHF